MTTPPVPQVGPELDAAVAEQVMGFRRWRFASRLPVAPGHEGPAPEDPATACYGLLTDQQAEEHFGQYALVNGMVRIADADTPPAGDAMRYVPRFSTDANRAEEVVERARRGRNFAVYNDPAGGPGYFCTIGGEHDLRGVGFGATMAAAMCRAALEAIAVLAGEASDG